MTKCFGMKESNSIGDFLGLICCFDFLKELYTLLYIYFLLPVIQGFDHLDLGLNLQLDVLSKAQEEQHQKHKHHFVASVSPSVVKGNKLIIRFRPIFGNIRLQDYFIVCGHVGFSVIEQYACFIERKRTR